MPKQPVTEALNLILTNQNVELQRQVTDLRRDLEEKRKEVDMLWKALERPSVSTMTEDQIHVAAEIIWQHIMGFPVKESKAS